MRHTYITLPTRMACLSQPVRIIKRDILAEIADTLEERKRIFRELEAITQQAKVIDMYLPSVQSA